MKQDDTKRDIEVRLGGGAVLRVQRIDDDTVRISRPGAWRQDLRRHEAGALAEALDAIATRA